MRGAERGAPRKLTELETVDTQAAVGGRVQPSLFPPAAGGVRVHLPGCHPCNDCTNTPSALKSINNKKLLNVLCHVETQLLHLRFM